MPDETQPTINLDHAPTRALLAELKPLVAEETAAQAEQAALEHALDRAKARAWEAETRVTRHVRAIAEIHDAKVYWGHSYQEEYHPQATRKVVLDALARLDADGGSQAPW